MEKLEEIVKLALWSAYVKGEKPVSLMVIAPPEHGKTSLVEKFKFNKGIVYFNDVTPWGLVKEVYKLTDAGEKVRHIIIPDFLMPLSKSQASSRAFVQFLNSMIEEGIFRIQTFGIEVKRPINCGVITCITSDKFKDKRRMWGGIGFLSRFLPFSYKYNFDTVSEILENIYVRGYHQDVKMTLNFPKEEVEIGMKPEFARQFETYTKILALKQGGIGFRAQKSFQALLQASALMDSRNEVSQEDVDKVKGLCSWINESYNTI